MLIKISKHTLLLRIKYYQGNGKTIHKVGGGICYIYIGPESRIKKSCKSIGKWQYNREIGQKT